MSETKEAGWTPGECDSCHGPVFGRHWLANVRDRLAWRLFMLLPDWLAFGRGGFAILPYAGGHAYTCSCFGKNAIARAALSKANGHG